MTRRTNATIAGFTYLFYIAVAFPSLLLMNRATAGEGMAARLATMAQHASDVRVAVLLSLLGCLSALVLAVTLYAITKDQDPDLAMLGLTCRVAEGVTGAVWVSATLVFLSITIGSSADAPDAVAVQTLGALVLDRSAIIPAWLFAVGSTLFSWLLLRGRMIPGWLAWLGVTGSALLVVGLPLQFTQVLIGVVTQLIWIPVAVFELVVAVWLMVKGVPSPEMSTR